MAGEGNRASLRSRRRISSALLKLMESSRFSDISIREITERAQLVRRTFYSHYASKEEVLDAYIAGWLGEFDPGMSTESPGGILELFLSFFDFCHHRRRVLRLLRRNGLSVSRIRLEVMLRGLPLPLNEAAGEFDYAFLAGGLSALIDRWADGGFRDSSEAMARRCAGYIDHLFDQAG